MKSSSHVGVGYHAVPIEYPHFLCDCRVASHEQFSLRIQAERVSDFIVLSQAVEGLVRFSSVFLLRFSVLSELVVI